MEWHWGNIGSFLAGLSTVVIAFAAVKQGPAVVRAWIDAKRAQTEKDNAEAETVRLERQRYLSGWSAGMVNVYGVTLVTDRAELSRARDELVQGDKGSAYVILRVTEGGSEGHDANRAVFLRRLIENEGYIARPPTVGEREAVERGLAAMGVRYVPGIRDTTSGPPETSGS
jgi:hypothetical protein